MGPSYSNRQQSRRSFHHLNNNHVKATFTSLFVAFPSLVLAFQSSRCATPFLHTSYQSFPSSKYSHNVIQSVVKPTSTSSLTYPEEQDGGTEPTSSSKDSILGAVVGTETATSGNTVSSPMAQAVASIPTLSLLHPKRMKFRMKLFSFLCQPKVEVVSAGAVLLSSLLVALSTLKDLPIDVDHYISTALWMLDLIFAADFFARWYAAGQFRWRYLTKPLAIIDLVVVIVPLVVGTIMPLLMYFSLVDGSGSTSTSSVVFPTHIDMVWSGSNSFFSQAGLQNLLLLRVLRLRRVLTDMTTFGRFTAALGVGTLNNSQMNSKMDRPYQLQLARVLLSIFTLLSVATGLIYTAEHDVNPDIPDYFTALYFGLTTLTTGT
jgi:Ion transport protein